MVKVDSALELRFMAICHCLLTYTLVSSCLLRYLHTYLFLSLIRSFNNNCNITAVSLVRPIMRVKFGSGFSGF